MKADQIRNYAENTHAAASNVFRLSQTLLQWARLQIGRVDYEPERLNIREIMTDIMDVYANISRRKSISVTLPDRDGWVFADQGMTETILRNLINNAIKFTHRGGLVELVIDETDSEVLVSVKDNGVGMSPAQVTIFNEQCLFDGTDGTAGESGTGLGLSISKEMIEKNGGRITVQSQEGLGTTFSFSLKRSTP